MKGAVLRKQQPKVSQSLSRNPSSSSSSAARHHHPPAHSPVVPAARAASIDYAPSSSAATPHHLDDHHPQPSYGYSSATSTAHPRYSLSDKTSTDLLGQRFDSLAVINSFDAIAYGAQDDAQPQPPSQPHTSAHDEPPSQQRPAQPTHSASATSTSRLSHSRAPSRLERSLAAAGRRMEDLTPRSGDSGARSPRQRYSDEAREGNKLKKKSGFSSFMNNLVGAPRKPTISAPENPVHVTHVGYDQNTGEFTVCICVHPHRLMCIHFACGYISLQLFYTVSCLRNQAFIC